MKLIKTVVFGVLFLLLVFLSSANTGVVEVAYLPPLPFGPFPEGASVEVPVFVVILGCILIGVLATGVGVLVEQTRLRLSTRSALKQAKRQQQEWNEANARVVDLEKELSEARGEADSARARLAETESRLAKAREELRASKPGAAAQAKPAAPTPAPPAATKPAAPAASAVATKDDGSAPKAG